MKETDLENQLRSWKPRPASPKIKERLFPRKAIVREFASVVRWIAPTAACGLMAIAVFRHEGGLQQEGHESGQMGLLGSNRAVVVFDSKLDHVNRLSGIFEWTNRSGSPFSKGSFLPGKVN
jgi:hypothetical protein